MAEQNASGVAPSTLVRLTKAIISSYVVGNHAQADRIGGLIGQVHRTLWELGSAPSDIVQPRKPAVSVSRSVQPDFVVCLEDGKRLKMLKRYLRARYGLTPEEYRRRWGLPADYPMVAPNYAARRSDFAKRIGLGKRR
jgi:predicted transcriptional regulator